MPSPGNNTLLIAPRGMLGRAWTNLLDARGESCSALDSNELDITQPDAVRSAITPETDRVINCAAWTDVDAAEQHESEATEVNGHAVGCLAERCRAVNALLVHYSTDYVFNGHADTPYPTNAPIGPINAYGRSKAVGEQRIREADCPHLLIRTSWLYAPWGKNFVLTMARLAAERDTLRVVHDQVGRPTSCEHLAATTMKLIDADARGTFHVTDAGQCSWYEFAAAIAAAVNPACRVEPCTSDEFPRPAKRPAYSVLDLTDTESILGPMPHWQTNLDAVLQTHRQTA